MDNSDPLRSRRHEVFVGLIVEVGALIPQCIGKLRETLFSDQWINEKSTDKHVVSHGAEGNT